MTGQDGHPLPTTMCGNSPARTVQIEAAASREGAKYAITPVLLIHNRTGAAELSGTTGAICTPDAPPSHTPARVSVRVETAVSRSAVNDTPLYVARSRVKGVDRRSRRSTIIGWGFAVVAVSRIVSRCVLSSQANPARSTVSAMV